MPTTNKWFVNSETEVRLVGVKDQNAALLDGGTEIFGRIGFAEHIPFTYGGTPGTFTGIVPLEAALLEGMRYIMKITIRPPGGNEFVVKIKRKASSVYL